MTHKKPPVIEGRIPDHYYNLDDDSELQALGLSLNARLKIADEYDHYPDCKWAIIEYKSRSLRNGVEQLEHTAERLFRRQKPVNLAIIVAIKMNKAERRIYTKKGNILYNKLTKNPIQIRVGTGRVEVNIYEVHEVDRQYQKYKRSLIPWVSN